MPLLLPTPKKTYQMAEVANTLLGSDLDNQRDINIKVKNQRVAFGNVVAGSSNGVTGGMDGVDRWISLTDIINTSWMVIAQPGSGAQDLLVAHLVGEFDWHFFHSPSGSFTGGNASTPPTAPDQSEIYANSFFGRGDGGSNPQFVCNMWVSTDLKICRLSYWYNNIPFGNIFYDVVDHPSEGWSNPNYAVMDKFGDGIAVSQGVGNVANWMFEIGGSGTGMIQAWGPSGQMPMTGTLEGSGINNTAGRSQPLCLAQTQKNGITGTYRNLPVMGLLRNQAYSDGGWHGRIFDIWWVPDDFNPGDETPLDGSDQFVIINNQLLKWNGTIFRTA